MQSIRGGASPSRCASRSGSLACVVLAASACSRGSEPSQVATYQRGSFAYLAVVANGHEARIGLDTAWGGTIVEVSRDGTNYVDARDPGREVQPSLYDGADSYDDCAGCTGVWGWNPVLGGDTYGHGSRVLECDVGAGRLYTKSTPLQWYPDSFGGGPDDPVEADACFEQTVTVVAGAPLAFRVHFKLSHSGSDTHYNCRQELPAVFVPSPYSTLVTYSGTEPWTGDALTRMAVPEYPGTPNVFSSECWSALANDEGNGLTVFVPTCYPYVHAIAFHPGRPDGSGNYYFRQFSSFTVEPDGVIEGEVYLIPGPVDEARKVVVALHETLPPVRIDTSLGLVETPAPGAELKGNDVVFGGWAIDDAAVEEIDVLVDGKVVGTPSLSVDRPDIVEKYPNAPLQCGWTFTFDSTTVPDGDHTVSVVITDVAGNIARMAPIAVTVAN